MVKANFAMDERVLKAKRWIDLVGSSLGLAISAPIWPAIMISIYLESPGPVFYRQRRAGRLLTDEELGDGEANEMPPLVRFVEFDMYKFRTMILDAEKQTGAVLAAENDPRITRIGRFLRKTRLDELPQLLNVLKGEMSLVGPRPERPERQANLALAIPFFEERMRNVKPGITGLAQIMLGYSGKALPGSEISRFEELLTNPFELEDAEGAEADDMRMKLLYDLKYVATLEDFKSFLEQELVIILKTPWVMIRGIGR